MKLSRMVCVFKPKTCTHRNHHLSFLLFSPLPNFFHWALKQALKNFCSFQDNSFLGFWLCEWEIDSISNNNNNNQNAHTHLTQRAYNLIFIVCRTAVAFVVVVVVVSVNRLKYVLKCLRSISFSLMHDIHQNRHSFHPFIIWPLFFFISIHIFFLLIAVIVGLILTLSLSWLSF